jgi:hypothetical protein
LRTRVRRASREGVSAAALQAVGDRDPCAFAREEARHRPAVPDRVGSGIERPLHPAYDEDPAPRETRRPETSPRDSALGGRT